MAILRFVPHLFSLCCQAVKKSDQMKKDEPTSSGQLIPPKKIPIPSNSHTTKKIPTHNLYKK